MATFHFLEVRNGDLDFEGGLRSAGIAYTKPWDGCDEFEAGEVSYRIDGNGKTSLSDIESADRGMIPLYELVKVQAAGGMAQFLEEQVLKLSANSWEEQESNFLMLS